MPFDYLEVEAGSKRHKDKNGFLHVDDCVITAAVVNEYLGNEIPDYENLGLDADKIYKVYRDPKAIQTSLEQINGLPILDDHDSYHDAETPQQHKRIGCIGSDAAFDGREVKNRLSFWNKRDVDAIESGRKVGLSMGYEYKAVMGAGRGPAGPYDLKMSDIEWNHLAHVKKGRVDGAVVADAANLAVMVKRAFDYSLRAGAKKKTGDQDMAIKKQKKSTGDRKPATRKRTKDEAPEEKGENRVIAGIKALASEFDDIHKENGINPGITDEESAVLGKVKDFLDSFTKGVEQAGSSSDPMDEDPDPDAEDSEEEETEDENEEEAAEDEGEEEEGAEDCDPAPKTGAVGQYRDVEKAKSPTGDKKRTGDKMTLDAEAIKTEMRREFRAKEIALDDVASLVGSLQKARALDSANDVYRFALKTHGIKVGDSVNTAGLRGMVAILKKQGVKVGDAASTVADSAIDAIMKTIKATPYAEML